MAAAAAGRWWRRRGGGRRGWSGGGGVGVGSGVGGEDRGARGGKVRWRSGRRSSPSSP